MVPRTVTPLHSPDGGRSQRYGEGRWRVTREYPQNKVEKRSLRE